MCLYPSFIQKMNHPKNILPSSLHQVRISLSSLHSLPFHVFFFMSHSNFYVHLYLSIFLPFPSSCHSQHFFLILDDFKPNAMYFFCVAWVTFLGEMSRGVVIPVLWAYLELVSKIQQEKKEHFIYKRILLFNKTAAKISKVIAIHNST